MTWETVRNAVLRAWRDTAGCSITITLTSGQKVAGQVTIDTQPGLWRPGVVTLQTHERARTVTHIIRFDSVAVVSISA